MKNLKDKIKHFSKGDFQIAKPDVVFPSTHLVLKIGEGEIYRGNFKIENTNKGDIRGLVYSSSIRMQCIENGFHGNPVHVEYSFDGSGLKPGDVEKGIFSIVCNGGEYEVGFTVIIEKPYIQTEYGTVQDLKGFKKVAFKNFKEAKRIFKSRDFYEILKYEPAKITSLYDNMRRWDLNESGLEEFLVAVKQKERIFLSFEDTERYYGKPDGILKDSINITKNTWGYLAATVSTDSEFIELPITTFSTDDFVGAQYELKYSIRNTQLHAGKNWGRIFVETPYEKITYTIELGDTNIDKIDRRKEDYIKAQFLKSLFQLEREKIFRDEWVKKGIEASLELQAANPDSEMHKLMQAHIYIIGKQFDEAKWIIEKYNYSKFPLGRDIEQDAYYLFLTALQRGESTHTKKVVEDLQRLYLKNPKSWKILLMLMQIDPYYNDYFERKHALENQYNLGANHLLFYLEANKCFNRKYSNLKKIGKFEVQVLLFSVKYKLITRELALYMANLVTQHNGFDKKIYTVLTMTYELYKEPMILQAICTILIKGNQTEHRYFKWYEIAVKEELKIAKLFEYYMLAIKPEDVTKPLPRAIHLYFAHGNTLPYESVAVLYSNLVMYEQESSDLYSYYRENIKQFAMAQLEKRRVSPQLKVLYRRFLTLNEMNNEKIKAIYDVLYSYLVTTKVAGIKEVLVIEEGGEIVQRVPYTEKGAQIILDSKDDIIVFETREGKYLVDSIKYDTKRLFYDLQFIEMCKKHFEKLNPSQDEEKEIEISLETLQKYGVGGSEFEEEKVRKYCSELIGNNPEENDVLIHICFELFTKECYDKNILEYLATFYCGPTRCMKEIWNAADDFEVEVSKLGERIISQMLFSENVLGEEEIFESYYRSGAYFRLEEAYIVYMSREYVVKERILTERMIDIFIDEIKKKPQIVDIVKVAVVKFYANHVYGSEKRQFLQHLLEELCEKQIYFDFYLKYEKELLRSVLLWDKTLITYKGKIGGKVTLYYQVHKEQKDTIEYVCEPMIPTYENIYAKKFLIFQDEILEYYFVEVKDDKEVKADKAKHVISADEFVGKYGRLNDITSEVTLRDEKMKSYALEEALADKIFMPYE